MPYYLLKKIRKREEDQYGHSPKKRKYSLETRAVFSWISEVVRGYTDISPTGHFPDWHFPEDKSLSGTSLMDTYPMDIFRNGQFPDRALLRRRLPRPKSFLSRRLATRSKKSRQKVEYLENKKSFWGEIKSIFHHF